MRDTTVPNQTQPVPSSWLEIHEVSRHDTSCPSLLPNKSIESLCDELNDLKRQFMPAAESCAEAVNAMHERNGSNESTNGSYEFRRARSICNLYESLGTVSISQSKNRRRKRGRSIENGNRVGSGITQFVNRSALKLANIDALLGFALVHSSCEFTMTNGPSARQDDYFAFADLCGAPGGFSEYILYRCVHPARYQGGAGFKMNNRSDDSNIYDESKIPRESINEIHQTDHTCTNMPCYGFGMSLSGSNEDGKGVAWNMSHLERYHRNQPKQNKRKRKSKHPGKLENVSHAGGTNHQNLHYSVCNGSDGTGSIYNWDNVLHLHRDVTTTLNQDNSQSEKPTGLVHLVVADGGFDAQRDSFSQEEIAHRIIVSQTAAALRLLARGGNFVIKMFGFQLERTKRVLRYLYRHFQKLVFIKPIVSRPASAERYLVCLGFEGCDTNWDGLVWIDQMTKDNYQTEDFNLVDDQLLRLNDSLHSFDSQMLQLNIDSCQSIIDYLQERKQNADKGEGSMAECEEHDTNLDHFEQSWKLTI